MSKTGRYTKQILNNAEILSKLEAWRSETVKHRDESQTKLDEWKNACLEYRRQYDALAFPGGFEGAYERILAGDDEAMEAAICFLECRPYFFRSGYMFKRILKKAKNAPLAKDQRERLDRVQQDFDAYRKSKHK